jgi:hypothetical protein
MLGLPFFDGIGRDAFHAEVHARHVVRRVDDKKQREGQQVDTDENRYGVGNPPDDIRKHQSGPV